MSSNMTEKVVNIEVNDIFDEMNAEIKRLLNELNFANISLNVLIKCKTLLNKVYEKYDRNIDSEDKSEFNCLNEELNSVNKRVDQIVKQNDFIKTEETNIIENKDNDRNSESNQTPINESTEVTAEGMDENIEMDIKSEPIIENNYKTNKETTDMSQHIDNNSDEMNEQKFVSNQELNQTNESIDENSEYLDTDSDISDSTDYQNSDYSEDEETEERKLVCIYNGCDQRFTRKDHLLEHIRRKHTFERPFECSECQKTFVRKSNLNRHKKNIHSVRCYECDECHKQFSSELYLLKHKKIHSRKPPINVTDEGMDENIEMSIKSDPIFQINYKTNGKTSDMSYHIDDNTDNKEENQKRDQTIQTNDESIAENSGHLDRDSETNKSIDYQNSQHLKDQTLTEEKLWFVCYYVGCGQVFPSMTQMEDHIRSGHTIEKPFKCTECEKAFISNSVLRVHKQIHLRNTFKCKECLKEYTSKSDLNRHKRIHSETRSFVHQNNGNQNENKSFVCHYLGCDKGYKHKKHLNEHIRRKHTSEKSFQCPECQKSFVCKYDLDQHKLSIHSSNRKLFSCHSCDYKTNRSDHLKRHISRKHICVIFESIIDLEDKQELNQLKEEFNSVITSKEQNNSSEDTNVNKIVGQLNPKLETTNTLIPQSSGSDSRDEEHIPFVESMEQISDELIISEITDQNNSLSHNFDHNFQYLSKQISKDISMNKIGSNSETNVTQNKTNNKKIKEMDVKSEPIIESDCMSTLIPKEDNSLMVSIRSDEPILQILKTEDMNSEYQVFNENNCNQNEDKRYDCLYNVCDKPFKEKNQLPIFFGYTDTSL